MLDLVRLTRAQGINTYRDRQKKEAAQTLNDLSRLHDKNHMRQPINTLTGYDYLTLSEVLLMNRGSTIFLQIVIVLIGVGALALMLWEPHIEGRNAHATLFEIYFKDPFLAYAYIASIPFFISLYQAFKVLGYVRQNKTFSPATVKALRTIKYCAIAIIGFVAVSVIFLMFADKDDRPAGVFMRILIAFPSIVIATAAAMFERILQNAVDIKSENDLTM